MLCFSVSIMFGLVTVLSGVCGVLLGSYLSRKVRPRFPNIDPVICAVGLLISSVFLMGVLITCQYYYYTCFLLIFLAEVTLNLNWSIVTDMLLVRSVLVFFWWLVGFCFAWWLFPIGSTLVRLYTLYNYSVFSVSIFFFLDWRNIMNFLLVDDYNLLRPLLAYFSFCPNLTVTRVLVCFI